MKPIEDCSLSDILELFEIEELTQSELKKAKKKVVLLHPDKNIGKDTTIYFEYFRKAYLKLEEIHSFLNTNTKQSTEYSKDFTTDTQKAFYDYYLKKGLDKDSKEFSKVFNEVFDNVHMKSEDGYGNWLKSNEGIYDKNDLEKSRQKAMKQLANVKQDIISFTDLDSQYSDLKEAHVNSVITMDVNDVFQKKEKFNSIEEYQRYRTNDTRNLNLMEKKQEHEQILNQQQKNEKMNSMTLAYEFMKETEKHKQTFNNYCSKFLSLN